MLQIQIDPYIFKSRSLFDLPNGWIVEKKPRKNMECAGIIDKVLFWTLPFASSVHIFVAKGILISSC